MVAVGSWGRRTFAGHSVTALTDRSRVAADIAGRTGLAYGMGRSYGDVCLNPGGTLWAMRGLDRFVAFDDTTGRLVCEAGTLLRDIQRTFAPRGWMLPVTPGTQLVTVGGAIANDVHGKNHHARGTFGEHVLRMTLARTDGSTRDCGPGENADWFAATLGGLGLTGVITQVELQLRRVPGRALATETVPFSGIDEFMALDGESGAKWEYTVAWIDCLAPGTRGIFLRANHDAAREAPAPPARARSMPVVPPVSLVNGLTLRPFNAAYYRMKAWNAGPAIVDYEPFFYPLDAIADWNRMYGPRGFHQYQCVGPRTGAREAVADLLRAIARAGQGSFLAVLKTFGDRPSAGLLSFPMPGLTLALDFPDRGEATEALFARLDAIVADAGGRLYPAKDGRMPRAMFERGYPRRIAFARFRDPGVRSAMSRRLLDD